eukprot:m.232572 g.232572  ORF g.232572 m.232572 type:complete len:50 (+) comp16020_c0_seq5:115-264(+)
MNSKFIVGYPSVHFGNDYVMKLTIKPGKAVFQGKTKSNNTPGCSVGDES